MTGKSNVEERILGILTGLGIGVILGFFLRNRERKRGPASAR
jgi:uncharacterized protein YneF (UPF0154 family)